MNDKLSLLRNIIIDPKCDVARLVYADYLQENGEEERAEFVRIQVDLGKLVPLSRLAKLDWMLAPDESREALDKVDELRRRERELWCDGAWEWLKLGGLHQVDTQQPCHSVWVDDNQIGSIRTLVTRGLISHVTCTAGDFLKYADQLVWNEGMVDACHCCISEAVSRGRRKCLDCNERGYIPRPIPPTAQPVEKVTLTTWPGMTRGWGSCRYDTERSVENRIAYYTRWPGIDFELPPVTSDYDDPPSPIGRPGGGLPVPLRRS